MLDAVIIGKGPAGISAALYACRAGLKTAVVGMNAGALEKAEMIENYYGLPSPVTGAALAETGVGQAKALGAEVITGEVTDISFYGSFITTAGERVFDSKTVILATGAQRKKITAEGLEEFEGKGVSYCAVCDAFFYRGKTVAVAGNGEYALHELNALLPVAGKAFLLTDGKPLKVAIPGGVQIIDKKIKRVYGGERLEGVGFSDRTEISADGLFIAAGSASAADFARKIGVETENGKIKTDKNMMSSVPGLFAAGDCTGGILQISVAVGEGARAALGAIEFIRAKLPV